MRTALPLLFFMVTILGLQAQAYTMSFEPFQGSSGEQYPTETISMPQNEIVYLNNAMNDRSGLGPTFNFHGNVVVLDYFNRLPDGTIQVRIRREDGKHFFGQLPTIQAILHPVTTSNRTATVVLN